jgi:hypothetical protein
MTTAYTSLLGLALPVTGELSGTWGDTANNAITSLLDTAVAGTTSITTDADITLTTTTGASNQARQAIILWNPASGTVTRNITAPAQSKIYTVINASGGTQSIVIRGVGPTTGVTIVKGESAVVAWNGTDFVKVSNTGGSASFTNVTVTGTTTLSGLTASTALALNASKEVVSVTNTGTGNNVLATSPTLVTPLLGTPTSVTLTNATGLPLSTGVTGTLATTNGGTGLTSFTSGGVVYASSSSALATGSALTFNGTNSLTLNASTASVNLGVTSSYGSVSAAGTNPAAIYFNGATRTSFESHLQYFGANHTFFNETGGSEIMRLLNTGNVGIGTTSPDQKLVVKDVNKIVDGIGNVFFATTDSQAADKGATLSLGGSYVGTSAYSFAAIAGKKTNSTSTDASGYLAMYTTNPSNTIVERARIDSSGNLGINITPSAWSSQFKAIQFGNAKYGTISQRNNSTSEFNLGWNVYNTSTGTSGSDGWVGLNTGDASSLYMLGGATHTWLVSNTAATAGSPVTWTASMAFTSSGNLNLNGTSGYNVLGLQPATAIGSGGVNYIVGINTTNIGFKISTTEIARFDTTGSFLINTTQQTSVGEKFLVSGYTGTVSDSVAAGIYAGASGTKDLNFYSNGNSQFFTAARIRVSSDIYTDAGMMAFWTTSNNGANVLTFSEKARITSTGTFVVNPNGGSSGNKLDIYGGGSGALGAIVIGDGTLSAGHTNYWNIGRDNITSGAFTFALNGSEVARFNTSGELCIGATTSGSSTLRVKRTTGGAALYVSQEVATNNTTATIYQTESGGNNNQNIGLLVAIQAQGSGDRIICAQFWNAGSPQDKFFVQRDGSTYNATGTYGTISDVRVKQDITDATSQWEDVKKIKFRKFRMIDDVEKYGNKAPYLMGPVAQELEEAGMKGLVETPVDKDGNETDLHKTVKLSIMQMKGMKALQEAMERIEQLEARLAAANL